MTPRRSSPGRAEQSSGACGEALAALVLQQRGYRIVARNLRTVHGEIDLLVRRWRRFVAVEVKTRRDHDAPERAVTGLQLDRIERGLRSLLPTLRPAPRSLGVDVVAIRWLPGCAEVSHFPTVRDLGPVGRTRWPLWRRATARSRAEPTTIRVLFPADPATGFAPDPLMPSLAEQIIPRRKLLLMVSETVILTGTLLVGTSAPPLSNKSFLLFEPSWELLRGLLSCLTIALICQASLSYNDLYDWKTAQNRAELPNRLVHSCGYALVMLALLVLVAPSLFFFPGIQDVSEETWKLILLLGLAFTVLYVFRHAFHWFFYKWRFGERVLVVGTSAAAKELALMIANNPLSGFEVMGLVDEAVTEPTADAPPPRELAHPAPVPPGGGVPVLGNLGQLRDLCLQEGIARVVVSLQERRGKVPVEQLLDVRMAGVQVEEREAMYERLNGKLAVESMRPSYLIYNRGFAKDPLTMALKRVVDIVAAIVGLVLSAPLCLLATLGIKLTSPGPVFFTQERVGQDGVPFRLIKFRTMRVDAEQQSGPVWAQQNDSRITPIGRLLRLSRIDEIPQFLNILAGSMSFVGPRPERPHFVEQLQHEIPFYPLRHAVKPGLTGWAQVRHPYGASVEDAREKLRYDLYYIKNMGLLFDLNIILRTIAVILSGKGAR